MCPDLHWEGGASLASGLCSWESTGGTGMEVCPRPVVTSLRSQWVAELGTWAALELLWGARKSAVSSKVLWFHSAARAGHWGCGGCRPPAPGGGVSRMRPSYGFRRSRWPLASLKVKQRMPSVRLREGREERHLCASHLGDWHLGPRECVCKAVQAGAYGLGSLRHRREGGSSCSAGPDHFLQPHTMVATGQAWNPARPAPLSLVTWSPRPVMEHRLYSGNTRPIVAISALG